MLHRFYSTPMRPYAILGLIQEHARQKATSKLVAGLCQGQIPAWLNSVSHTVRHVHITMIQTAMRTKNAPIQRNRRSNYLDLLLIHKTFLNCSYQITTQTLHRLILYQVLNCFKKGKTFLNCRLQTITQIPMLTTLITPKTDSTIKG